MVALMTPCIVREKTHETAPYALGLLQARLPRNCQAACFPGTGGGPSDAPQRLRPGARQDASLAWDRRGFRRGLPARAWPDPAAARRSDGSP
jgi:hypothetical protein